MSQGSPGEPQQPDGAGVARRGGGRRAWLTLVARALLTIAVLGILFYNVPGEEMWAALSRTSFGMWLVLLAGMTALHALTAMKWRLFLTASGVRTGALPALRAHGAGLFANLFLPGLVATDVVRATMLARDGEQVVGSLPPIAIGSIADRLVDTGSLVVLGALGAAVATGGGAYWATPAAIGVLLVAGSLLARPLLRRLQHPRLPEKLRRLGDRLEESVSALVSRPGTALLAGALSIALQAGFVLLAIRLGRAVGIDVPAAAWFLAFPIAKLTILVPITISGLGVREAALAGLLLPFGVDPAVAVVQGLLWQSLQMGLAVVGGSFAYGVGRWLPSPPQPRSSPRAQGHGNPS